MRERGHIARRRPDFSPTVAEAHEGWQVVDKRGVCVTHELLIEAGVANMPDKPVKKVSRRLAERLAAFANASEWAREAAADRVRAEVDDSRAARARQKAGRS